jgi:hypothetical protein
MTGLEPLARVAGGHPFLTAVLMKQRPGIQIQRVILLERWQRPNRLPMQARQRVATALAENIEETPAPVPMMMTS